MAKQDGIILLRGTIDNLTFYKTKYGYFARKKSSLNALRIATDPAFERTRENCAEFTNAVTAGKTLRNALGSMINGVADKKMASRLNRRLMQVLKGDVVNKRGSRNVTNGDIQLLEGFRFNEESRLASFLPRFTSTIDQASGRLHIDIPGLQSAKLIQMARRATHVKLFSAAVEINFETGQLVVDTKESLFCAEATIDGAFSLAHAVTPGSAGTLLLVMGMEFYQCTNGKLYPLKSGAYNPVEIVKVNSVQSSVKMKPVPGIYCMPCYRLQAG
jgi:hypothetical protein